MRRIRSTAPRLATVRRRLPEAGRRKLRRGANALLRRAEHLAFQREMDPRTSARQLAQALRLVRAAKRLDEEERPKPRGRRRRKPTSPGGRGRVAAAAATG